MANAAASPSAYLAMVSLAAWVEGKGGLLAGGAMPAIRPSSRNVSKKRSTAAAQKTAPAEALRAQRRIPARHQGGITDEDAEWTKLRDDLVAARRMPRWRVGGRA